MFALLRQNPAFRQLTLYATFGAIGRGMFTMVMMWAVHAAFHNAMLTGVAGFAFALPHALSFLIGPLVDRWRKIWVLRVVEFVELAALLALLITHLTVGSVAWVYLTVILVFTSASTFRGPAQFSLMPKLLGPTELTRANVLMNVVTLMGALVLGGVLLSISGDDINFTAFFTINAALVSVAAVLAWGIRYVETFDDAAAVSGSDLRTYFGELREGLAFARRGAILIVLAASMGLSFGGDIAYVNFPNFIETHLGSAESYLIFMMLVMVGSLFGSLFCRLTENRLAIWQVLAGSLLVSGLARAAFVFLIPRQMAVAVAAYLLYVGLITTFNMSVMILTQRLPAKRLVGRITTVDTSLSFAAAAIGALIGGVLGSVLHVDWTLLTQAAILVVLSLFVASSTRVRALGKVNDLPSAG